MNMRESAGLKAQMTAKERARLVAALDHDVRQPQHSIRDGPADAATYRRRPEGATIR